MTEPLALVWVNVPLPRTESGWTLNVPIPVTATPAPPAVGGDVSGTFGRAAVRTSPVDVFPTTWIVAVPLKLAIPPDKVTGPETDPLTCICETLAHGPNGNPPDRPAITQRNSPPDDDAVNPSCEVVPKGPSTIPPPLTLGPDAYATDCDARSVLIARTTLLMNTRVPGCFMSNSPPASRKPAGGIALGPSGAPQGLFRRSHRYRLEWKAHAEHAALRTTRL